MHTLNWRYTPGGVCRDHLKEIWLLVNGVSLVRVYWSAIWFDHDAFGIDWLVDRISETFEQDARPRVIVPPTDEYFGHESMYRRVKAIAHRVLGSATGGNGVLPMTSLALPNGAQRLVPAWDTHFPESHGGALQMPLPPIQASFFSIIAKAYPVGSSTTFSEVEEVLRKEADALGEDAAAPFIEESDMSFEELAALDVDDDVSSDDDEDPDGDPDEAWMRVQAPSESAAATAAAAARDNPRGSGRKTQRPSEEETDSAPHQKEKPNAAAKAAAPLNAPGAEDAGEKAPPQAWSYRRGAVLPTDAEPPNVAGMKVRPKKLLKKL